MVQKAQTRADTENPIASCPARPNPRKPTRPAPGATCGPATRKRRRPAAPHALPAKTSAGSRCSPPRGSSRRPGRRSSRRTPSRASAAGSASTPASVPATAANSTTHRHPFARALPCRHGLARRPEGSPGEAPARPDKGGRGRCRPLGWRQPGSHTARIHLRCLRSVLRGRGILRWGFRSTGCPLPPCEGRSPGSRLMASSHPHGHARDGRFPEELESYQCRLSRLRACQSDALRVPGEELDGSATGSSPPGRRPQRQAAARLGNLRRHRRRQHGRRRGTQRRPARRQGPDSLSPSPSGHARFRRRGRMALEEGVRLTSSTPRPGSKKTPGVCRHVAADEVTGEEGGRESRGAHGEKRPRSGGAHVQGTVGAGQGW